MIQASAVAMFDWLDTWADGDLREFASWLEHAPQDHLRSMVEAWPSDIHELDPLTPGQLRPLVGRLSGSREMVRTGLRLLLYTDSVIIEDAVLHP